MANDFSIEELNKPLSLRQLRGSLFKAIDDCKRSFASNDDYEASYRIFLNAIGALESIVGTKDIRIDYIRTSNGEKYDPAYNYYTFDRDKDLYIPLDTTNFEEGVDDVSGYYIAYVRLNMPHDVLDVDFVTKSIWDYVNVGGHDIIRKCRSGEKYNSNYIYYTDPDGNNLLDTTGFNSFTEVYGYYIKEFKNYQDIAEYVNAAVQTVFNNLYDFVTSNYSTAQDTQGAITDAVSDIAIPETATNEEIEHIVDTMYTTPALAQITWDEKYNSDYK